MTKLYRNWIINEVARAGEHTNKRTYVRTHIHTYGSDPISPPQLCCARPKRELVRGIVISNTCVKLYRNWIINEVARAGEHMNERTYIAYSHT